MNKGLVIHITKEGIFMANEIVKSKKELSGALKLQDQLLNELDTASQQMGADFTDYGKKCVINAIGGLVSICSSQGIELTSLNPTLLRLSLQNIGYTELNYAAMPSEVYFDLRKNVSDENKVSYVATIKPQGAGNEKLVRKYGVGLKKDTGLKTAWLVREGDDFTFPSYDGLKMTPPKWTPKSFDKKVIMVVYPAEKIDGTVEYLIATRESVKANIIAQIRQNTLYAFKEKYRGKDGKEHERVDKEKRDKFYADLDAKAEKMTVDQRVNDAELIQYINPTYTSGGSKEQMILRKMKNNALKNYPKEYDNAYIRDAVENMFEDKDDSLDEKPKKIEEIDAVKKVEEEINEESNAEAVQDFQVDEDGVVQRKTEEEPVEEQKPQEKKVEEEVEASEQVDEEDKYGF